MDRSKLIALIAKHTRGMVHTGPFRGMKMALKATWADGDLTSKLLGIYEQELHPYLEKFAKETYDEVVDIGSAEGYYAVGCTRLFPELKIRAFDLDEKSHIILAENAALNGVSDRLIISGYCDSRRLELLAKDRRLFLVVDCEGGEMSLLRDQSVVDALKHSDLIIECHDFIDPATTGVMVGRFFATHSISIVYGGGRNPNEFPFLANLTDAERWAIVCENRPVLMNWIVCSSKNPVPG